MCVTCADILGYMIDAALFERQRQARERRRHIREVLEAARADLGDQAPDWMRYRADLAED